MSKKINCKYFTNGTNEVVAVAKFNGKVVRGVAKCGPNDVFDLEKGKALAAARCAAKIARKRMIQAREDADWYASWKKEAEQNYVKAAALEFHATEDYNRAQFELENLLSTM